MTFLLSTVVAQRPVAAHTVRSVFTRTIWIGHVSVGAGFRLRAETGEPVCASTAQSSSMS